MIITGKASVYSDKMTSSSGRWQISQWPDGIKITAIKVGKPGITGEIEGRKEGRLLMPPFPQAAFNIINPFKNQKFSVLCD